GRRLLQCGISGRPMSGSGHSRPRWPKPHHGECPLRPESRQNGRRLGRSALCPKRTHALQRERGPEPAARLRCIMQRLESPKLYPVQRRNQMKLIAFSLVGVATLAGVVAFTAPAVNQEGAPIVVTNIPPGYRDWRLISVVHEEGNLHSFSAVLGNDL